MNFNDFVESFLQAKITCPACTRQKLLQYIRRLQKGGHHFGELDIHSLSVGDCAQVISACWSTPAARNEARRILHNMFTYAEHVGWMSKNPLDGVECEAVPVQLCEPLSLAQVGNLLRVVSWPQYRCCAPAVGLMLWAGIRSYEVRRLRWHDIHFDSDVIVLGENVSKTGIARRVTLQPILLEWLRRTRYLYLLNGKIVPRAWIRLWKEIRNQAAFHSCSPDSLRYTFAAYHIRKFGNFVQLQHESGLSSSVVQKIGLRAAHIPSAEADIFWGELPTLLLLSREGGFKVN